MIIGKTRTNQPVEDEGMVDARIEDLVEGGTLDNAKPIYYHPITIRNTALGYISMLILDNQSEAYTKTTFKSKIANFDRICPLSGAVFGIDNKVLICAYAFKQSNKHYILGLYTDGSYEDTTTVSIEDILDVGTTSFSDGVNKVN